MLAARIHSYGNSEVIKVEEIEEPHLGVGKVLVRIEAAGVNFLDIYFRKGVRKGGLPLVLGNEGAGTVVDVAEDVAEFKKGDRVAFLYGASSYAQYAAVSTKNLVKLPAYVDCKIAAAVLLQGATAHYLTRDTYQLKPGNWCLVQAAAGGTGALIVQMAKRCGAGVIAAVSKEEKIVRARAAGADHVLVSSLPDFASRVKEISDGLGVHVVYDGVGKSTFEISLQCLRPLGLLSLFGQASGPVPPFELGRLAELGSLFVTRPSLPDYIRDATVFQQRAEFLWEMIKDGKLEVRIAGDFPIRQARQAHELLESGQAAGKVILYPFA